MEKKEIKTTDANKIFKTLFTGWEKKLPYCTAGRPIYIDSDKYSEEREVDFLFFGKPAKAIFKRMIGQPTNYVWGLRDVGTKFTLIIDNLTISHLKESEYKAWESREKVVTYRYSNNFSAISRVLKAVKDNIVPKFSTDKNNPNSIVYFRKYEEWHNILSVVDFLEGFIYETKYKAPHELAFSYYHINESALEL